VYRYIWKNMIARNGNVIISNFWFMELEALGSFSLCVFQLFFVDWPCLDAHLPLPPGVSCELLAVVVADAFSRSDVLEETVLARTPGSFLPYNLR